MTKILPDSIFYKMYLYYNLYIRNKAYKKRKSYSQDQEDLFINSYFKNIDNGFYLDIGCYHPIKYSNTALLYNRGWRGINIDMNQTSIDLFKILRKKDKNICAAISSTNKEVTQFIDHLFSPINTIDKNFSQIISKKFKIKPFSEKNIFTNTLNEILEKYKIQITKIDFLNIDVEGHDYEVLRGINLCNFKPKIICIEIDNHEKNLNKENIQIYLKKLNYKIIKRIGFNAFFERN
ncbi:FkbM family methyltransferase [Candidatus Pelagibacter sp. HIMB1509]|uniref:FkbM family methyltransferase n=1 Tax=Candidatus Pelagibacter sp. HIMB1509 TaxID=3413339 RepID=UPI003F876CBE